MSYSTSRASSILSWRRNTTRTAIRRPPCVFHCCRNLAVELRDICDNRARFVTNLHSRQINPGLVVLKLLGSLPPALARFCVEACGCTSVVVEASPPRIAAERILSAVWAGSAVRVRPAGDLTSVSRASLSFALLQTQTKTPSCHAVSSMCSYRGDSGSGYLCSCIVVEGPSDNQVSLHHMG